MQPSLVAAATALLLALLTTAAVAVNTSIPCVPALCGNISISYPFWLTGTHPPECGYKAFQITCDKQQGNVSLANSFMKYRILDIFYPNNSFRVINAGVMSSNDTCDFDKYFNVTSDLGLSPFKISPKNQELFLFYDCDLRESQTPRSWTRLPCPKTPYGNSSVFALLGKEYMSGGIGIPPPMNCNESMIPVLGYGEGATGADFHRLMNHGFLLEYTGDDGACAACTGTRGQCRVDASSDAFECHCSNGGDDMFICDYGEYLYAYDLY
ncbi:unnamed protein product [Urochloa humidicola]